jgi:hypothetical protein
MVERQKGGREQFLADLNRKEQSAANRNQKGSSRPEAQGV